MKLAGSKQISHEKVNELIAHGLNYVYFRKELEPIYRQQYRDEAAYEFRFRGSIILVLYFVLSYGIFQTISIDEKLIHWLSLYAWVGVITIAVWLMSFSKPFNRFFDLYTTLGATSAVAISFVIIPVIGQDIDNDALLHVAMMYAVVINYSFVGMRFYSALIAGWGGGLIGYLVTVSLNYDIDWTFLHRTYTFSSLLGMIIAYAIDRQHHENYLQNCIIELHKEELTQQAQELERLTQLDALTGLANRRYLTKYLDTQWRHALRHQAPLSIMMVDIDYFKNYNDHFGHIAGDACLQLVAQQLQGISSRSMELAARYGGEEFLLVYPYIDEVEIQKIAQELIQRINALQLFHPASQVSGHVTVSIGCASIKPQENDRLADFVAQADEALYAAKAEGRNRFKIAPRQSKNNVYMI